MMGTYSETEWIRPEDKQWGYAVRWRLAVGHPAAGLELIEQVLTEAQEACADSGQPAQNLFGDAEAYADEVAAERITEEARAAVDMDGIAPAEQLQGALLAVGFIGTGLSIVLILKRGLVFEMFPWQLALLAAGIVALAAAVGGVMARRAGQVRRSWSLVGLAVGALGAGTAVAAPLAEHPALGELSTFVPLAASVALFVIVWNMPRPAGTKSRPELPAEKWFAQLDGLLRGRYYLARADASGYVAEARTAWQESGAAHPQDELGSPQVYALQLVDGSPQPHRARRHFLAWAATAIAAMWAVLTVVYLWDGLDVGQLVWRLFATTCFIVGAVIAWRRHLRDRRQASGTGGA